MMKNEYKYFKKEKMVNGGIDLTIYKIGVWQTRPEGTIEITEEEYNTILNK